ncbi:hypothetical protein L873DRAFT_1819979 [Choiromyces venosus 120613-1]|uniref:Uncharacterized protein n=1 Tax=Choiromyces venosus 120613-1 TaxID=1336337 RepID=A0A3N4J1P6_9PEZI|nr:hypothetical protein L873DRAFT_1819979 [Choiromyces venosus 120613-1]
MDSDDDLSSIGSAPDTTVITTTLRNAVQKQFAEDASKTTIKYIRARVENELNLGDDFLKQDSFWKAESKRIIEDEASKQNALQLSAEPPISQKEPTPEKQSPVKVTEKPAKKRASKVKKVVDKLGDGAIESPKKPAKKPKGVTPVKSTARKARAKPTILEDEDEDEEVEAKASKENTTKQASESELSELDASPKRVVKRKKSATKPTPLGKKAKKTHEVVVKEGNAENGEAKVSGDEAPVADEDPGNESEMSVVLDPKPLKKSRSQNPGAGSSKKPGKAKVSKERSKKGSSKAVSNLSPDEEKIKTLQQWLLKCGIRKFWSKELAKFETPKEKIKHLTGLLTDVGMTPRYSNGKAKEIKAERELQAEVKAVQEGAKWAKADDGVNTRSTRSAPAVSTAEKKQIRGMEDLAFLDDQSDSD